MSAAQLVQLAEQLQSVGQLVGEWAEQLALASRDLDEPLSPQQLSGSDGQPSLPPDVLDELLSRLPSSGSDGLLLDESDELPSGSAGPSLSPGAPGGLPSYPRPSESDESP